MSFVRTIAYELSEWVVTFIPFLFFWIVRNRKCRKQNATLSRESTILLFGFALYIIGVFYVTGAGTLYDAIGLRAESIGKHINIIPFSQGINIKGYVLNIVLFMPFGFLVPMIWGNKRTPT